MFPFPGENTEATTTDAETVAEVAAAVVENETGQPVTAEQQTAELDAVRKAELEAALAALGFQLVPIEQTPTPSPTAPASPAPTPAQPVSSPASDSAAAGTGQPSTEAAPAQASAPAPAPAEATDTPTPVDATPAPVPDVSTGA